MPSSSGTHHHHVPAVPQGGGGNGVVPSSTARPASARVRQHQHHHHNRDSANASESMKDILVTRSVNVDDLSSGSSSAAAHQRNTFRTKEFIDAAHGKEDEDDVVQSVAFTAPLGPQSAPAGGESSGGVAAAPRTMHGLQCELRKYANAYTHSNTRNVHDTATGASEGAQGGDSTATGNKNESDQQNERDYLLITQIDSITVEISELLLATANISAGDASALSEIIHSAARLLPPQQPLEGEGGEQRLHLHHLAACILHMFHVIVCNVNGMRVAVKALREHMSAVVAWIWAAQRDAVPAAKLASSVVSIIVTYADDGVDVARGVVRNARIHFEERAVEYVRAAGCGGAVANMVSMLRVLLSTTPPPPPEDVECIVRIADAVTVQLASDTRTSSPSSKESVPIVIELLHLIGTAALVLDGNDTAVIQQQQVMRCYTQHLRGIVVDCTRRHTDGEPLIDSSNQSTLQQHHESEVDAITHQHLLLMLSFADMACGESDTASNGSPVQQQLSLSTRAHADPSSSNDLEGRARMTPSPPPPLPLQSRQNSSPDNADGTFGGALCDAKKLYRELREVQRARLDYQKQLSAFNNAAVILLNGTDDNSTTRAPSATPSGDGKEGRHSLAALALCIVPGGLRTLFSVLSSVDEVTSTRACTVLAAILEVDFTPSSSQSSGGRSMNALAASYRDTLVQEFVLMGGLPLLAEMLDDYALPVLVGATRVVHAILRVSQNIGTCSAEGHDELSAMRHLCCTYKCIARIGTSVIPALNRPDESNSIGGGSGALDETAAVLDGFQRSAERLEALQYCVSIARMLPVEEARKHLSDDVVAALNHVVIACRAQFPPAAAIALHGLEALAPAFPTIVAASLDLEYFRCVACGDADGIAVFGTPLAEEILQTMLRCMGSVVPNLPYIVTYEWVEALHAALNALCNDSAAPTSTSARAAMWRALVATLTASPDSADFILGDGGDADGVMQRVDVALERIFTCAADTNTAASAHLLQIAKEEELVWLLLLASFSAAPGSSGSGSPSNASCMHLAHINQLAQIMSSTIAHGGNSTSVFPLAAAASSSTTSAYDSLKAGRKSRCGSSNILLRHQQHQQPMSTCVPNVSNRMRLAWVPYLRGLLQRLCHAATKTTTSTTGAPDVNRQRRITEAVEALFYTVFYVDDGEYETEAETSGNVEGKSTNSATPAGTGTDDMNINTAAVVRDVDAISQETYFRFASAPILESGMNAMMAMMDATHGGCTAGTTVNTSAVSDVRSERVARVAFATLTECAPHSVIALCAMARESVQILLSSTDSDSYSADAAHDRLVALGPLINGVLFTAPPAHEDPTTASVVSALASQLLSLAAFRPIEETNAYKIDDSENTVNAVLLDMLTAPFFTVALRLLRSGLSGDDAALKSLSDRLYGSPTMNTSRPCSGAAAAAASGEDRAPLARKSSNITGGASAQPFLLTLSSILDQFPRKDGGMYGENEEEEEEEALDAMELLRAAMEATEQLLLVRRVTEAVLVQDELLPAFLTRHVLPNVVDVHECQSLLLFCLQWTSVQHALVNISQEAYVEALQYIAAAGTAASCGNGNNNNNSGVSDAQLRYTTLIANKYLTDMKEFS